MTFESEQAQKHRRSLEGREVGVEEKENQADVAELKKAAGLERADIIVKEVKQSQKQMQNIVLHIQTVLNAIRQLRLQLQLAETSDDPASIRQDKKQVEILKKQIQEYGDELERMRGDLIREQLEELSRREDGTPTGASGKNSVGAGMTTEQLQRKAEQLVDEMIKTVKE